MAGICDRRPSRPIAPVSAQLRFTTLSGLFSRPALQAGGRWFETGTAHLAYSAGGSVWPGATGLPEPPDAAERTILSEAVWETLSPPASHNQWRPEKARWRLPSYGGSAVWRPLSAGFTEPSVAAERTPPFGPCENTVPSGVAQPVAPRVSEIAILFARRLRGALVPRPRPDLAGLRSASLERAGAVFCRFSAQKAQTLRAFYI